MYRLRDENGQEFTDLFEIHIIELKKEPEDCSPLNEWIQLINAENVEELDMIRTCNAGIMEAIETVKTMNLIKGVRYLYEAHLKAVRDRWAEDEYVKDQGKAEAKTEWLLQMLDGLGTVPDALRERILAQTDLDILDDWFKAAGKAGSIEEFYSLTGLYADFSRDTF